MLNIPILRYFKWMLKEKKACYCFSFENSPISHPPSYTNTDFPSPSHIKSVQLPPYPPTPPPILRGYIFTTLPPPTPHLTAGTDADFFSFDLASAGLNEGIILGPRTLCLIPGGPASGGESEPLPLSGGRMLQERNQ